MESTIYDKIDQENNNKAKSKLSNGSEEEAIDKEPTKKGKENKNSTSESIEGDDKGESSEI